MSPEPTAPLRADVVYLSPSGRRCRWVPGRGEHRQITSYATFVYVDQVRRQRHTEAADWREGFHLTPANYQLLRVAYP
jgi:hypothetical protein